MVVLQMFSHQSAWNNSRYYDNDRFLSVNPNRIWFWIQVYVLPCLFLLFQRNRFAAAVQIQYHLEPFQIYLDPS